MVNIKSYKLKTNEIRYKFHIYIGTDPLTGKEKQLLVAALKQRKKLKRLIMNCNKKLKMVLSEKFLKTRIRRSMNYG